MNDEGATPNISITERAKLVKDHICFAALFARNTFEIERIYKEHVPQDLSEQLTSDHTAYVIGSLELQKNSSIYRQLLCYTYRSAVSSFIKSSNIKL